LVILVGKPTVAKVHSIGFVVHVDPTLGRIGVELEQQVGVIDDLGDRFRAVRAVVDLESLIATCALSMSVRQVGRARSRRPLRS
jgi:hypothetical protein